MDDGLIVPAVSDALSGFADMPRVFATAYLVAFVENSTGHHERHIIDASKFDQRMATKAAATV